MDENKQNQKPLNKDFKVPKLRFKKFNKPWKKENFATLFQYIPTNSLSWDALNYMCGSLRNLHYGIIHSNTNEILSAVNLPFINNCSIPKKYTKAIPGDLFLADTSEDRKDCGPLLASHSHGDGKASARRAGSGVPVYSGIFRVYLSRRDCRLRNGAALEKGHQQSRIMDINSYDTRRNTP